jgi:hypothetical protein
MVLAWHLSGLCTVYASAFSKAGNWGIFLTGNEVSYLEVIKFPG